MSWLTPDTYHTAGLERGTATSTSTRLRDNLAIDDARAVLVALADPETLYVFGVIAARTSMLGVSGSDRTRSTPYVTPFGVMRETSLSRDAVEAAAERLKRAGLLEVLLDDERGYEGWRISEAALAAAVT